MGSSRHWDQHLQHFRELLVHHTVKTVNNSFHHSTKGVCLKVFVQLYIQAKSGCFFFPLFLKVMGRQQLFNPPLFFSGAIHLKLRAPLRRVTNLLIARSLRFKSVVDRLKEETEVREIVQPVRPPRSNVIKPRAGHPCSQRSVHRTLDAHTLPRFFFFLQNK